MHCETRILLHLWLQADTHRHTLMHKNVVSLCTGARILYCTICKDPFPICPSVPYSVHNAVDLMMHYRIWCTRRTTLPSIYPTPFTIKVQLRGL